MDRAVGTDVIPYCRDSGVTVIAYSPLARGIANIKARLSYEALETVAEATGKTEAQVALNRCIAEGKVVAIPTVRLDWSYQGELRRLRMEAVP